MWRTMSATASRGLRRRRTCCLVAQRKISSSLISRHHPSNATTSLALHRAQMTVYGTTTATTAAKLHRPVVAVAFGGNYYCCAGGISLWPSSVRWKGTNSDGKQPKEHITEKEGERTTGANLPSEPNVKENGEPRAEEKNSTTSSSTEKEAVATDVVTDEARMLSGSTIASEAAAATQRLRRVVDDLNLGDQLSVVLIAVFTAILLTAPYAVRHMKQQAAKDAGYDDRLQTDDPVDEFAKLARQEWGMLDENYVSENENGDSGSGQNKNIVEFLLKDVFKSTALQHAAQEFVVQILQSDRFKEAVSRLVQELWSDLVTDTETVAQVIKLLEIAIQSPVIKSAVIDLVMQIAVREPELRESMIGMIENLAQDEAVQQAVVRLLTDAAHTTLNDPDLLDHSMEFATDVVGDDTVQQTAGEALRKSVGHAVKPATTVLLTALGVGLIIFGIISLGYSLSSEQEAVLFETAVRSLHSNAAKGILRIVTWPFRTLQVAVYGASSLLWHSISVRQSFSRIRAPLDRASEAIYRALRDVTLQTISLPWWMAKSTAQWLNACAATLVRHASEGIRTRQASFSARSLTGSALATTGAVASSIWTYTVSRSQLLGKASVTGLSRAVRSLVYVLAHLVAALRGTWRRTTSRKGNLDAPL